jgi:hypothetical protein
MESLTNFIVWSLAVFGISNIIVFSSLLKSFRESIAKWKWQLPGKLVNCILCVSFWIGITFGLTVWSPAEMFIAMPTWYNTIFEVLFNGALGSSVSWLIFLGIKQRMLGA